MSEGLYSGVRVVPVGPDVVNEVYREKCLRLDDQNRPEFDKRLRFNYQNEFIVLKFDNGASGQSALTRVKGQQLELLPNERHGTQGVIPRNKEQRMAFDVLLDPDVKVVVMTGRAGTGKTLMALATALETIQSETYDRMILTRPMSWVGKHGLGALPGDVDEKFGPYLENYMCNIEFLLNGNYKSIPDLINHFRMDFVPLQLIRGASWRNTIIIADEVQVLDHDDMVALGTRVGENSKIIIMGDLGQRDEKIAKDKTGLYRLVNNEKTKCSPLVATIDLIKCERSPVAELFADVFER